MRALRRVRVVFWLMILAGLAGTSWGQPNFVFKRGEAAPSRLKTVLGPVSQTVEKHKSYIGCYDALNNGSPANCSFVMNINGLAAFGFPEDELSGGHSHAAGRPFGQLRFGGTTGSQVNGQTANTQVVVEHLLPQVGGVIERRLDLFVPPGWRTVDPHSCDATRSFWCFLHHLNVKVEQQLEARSGPNCQPLPPAGTMSCKLRAADMNHTDAVAFYGTFSTQVLLSEVAHEFQRTNPQGLPLAANDISLISGGFFDLQLNWRTVARAGAEPHFAPLARGARVSEHPGRLGAEAAEQEPAAVGELRFAGIEHLPRRKQVQLRPDEPLCHFGPPPYPPAYPPVSRA
ncbi:MAG: hypothetical protein L0099_13325 [Acidobacteria bacterium]|nr:hypothetical protein [Acidobacteriota bacterium]